MSEHIHRACFNGW